MSQNSLVLQSYIDWPAFYDGVVALTGDETWRLGEAYAVEMDLFGTPTIVSTVVIHPSYLNKPVEELWALATAPELDPNIIEFEDDTYGDWWTKETILSVPL